MLYGVRRFLNSTRFPFLAHCAMPSKDCLGTQAHRRRKLFWATKLLACLRLTPNIYTNVVSCTTMLSET